MNMHTRNRARAGLILALTAVFSLLCPSALAAGERGTVDVVKQWRGDGQLPQTVTLYLKNGGSIVSSLSLSTADARSDGSWAGSFEDVPLYDAQGNAIQYSVDEEPIPGWELTVTQLPAAGTLRIDSWGQKVTPASESRYPIGKADLVAANKGSRYYVWTRDELSESERELLLREINSASLQGFGAELSFENTHFESGLPARFTAGVGIYRNGEEAYVSFERTNVWSLFYSGSIGRAGEREARLINSAAAVSPPPTSTPTPTPAPDHTPAPSPTASPQPSLPPSQPPKTGDGGVSGAAAALALSLCAAGLLVWKLKKQ